MPRRRNVVTLSDMPQDLMDWTNSEAARRRRLRLPNWHFYAVVNDGLRLLKEQTRPGPTVYFLKDGPGPFFTVHEALDALGVPREARGLYWHRHDRLPKEYAEKIIPMPWKGDGAEAPAPRQEPD
ncbi:MAG: hypothetical protein Q8O40_08730 [Chloroflexota bacterium]|nr:hypothetical protein [Chloroflexota bacterium]